LKLGANVLKRKAIIIIIVICLAAVLAGILLTQNNYEVHSEGIIGKSEVGNVEKLIYGNASADTTIALITGMHPRETLAIEPEIQAAKEFSGNDVKIIHYKVTVTDSPDDYEVGRENGESLVHDFVNHDVTSSDADFVVISHSHEADYGEGFYLATPEMDSASVGIAQKISDSSDFNYYPVTGNETYKSTSAVLVSKPIASAGYPTFVYEIPENIMEFQSTSKTKELFDLLIKNA
jgi:hypothetical protein